jgi:hypothetical protein
MVRTFVLGGRLYQATLKPARIRTKAGESEQYPSDRERLVEWVIRRIAARRNRLNLGDKNEVGVSFSIHEVRVELKRTGHTYSHNEIVEALTILRESAVEIVRIDTAQSGETRERVINSSAFPQLAFADRRRENAKTTVQFNWLVSEALMHLDFRQMNYEKVMHLPGPIERWIYLRLNHDVLFHRMDPKVNVHELRATEVIEGCALANRKRGRDTLRRITEAMSALKIEGVILDFEAQDILEGQKKVDVLYTITVTREFVHDTTRSLRTASESLTDFRDAVGSEPVEFIPNDYSTRDKLRKIRNRRRAEADIEAVEGSATILALPLGE